MTHQSRFHFALAFGAAMALSACGGSEGTNDTAAIGDSAATAMTPTADSAAGAMGATPPAGAMSAPNIMAMIGLSNAGEIATSQIAVDKATNAQVRQFARDMVTEHQAMQGEADQLAARLNVQVEQPPAAEQKKQMSEQMVQQLNTTAKGAAFDKAYIDGQVQAHQQTLTELQSFQTSTDNAELRGLIEKAIPKVQAHLQQAQQLQSSLTT